MHHSLLGRTHTHLKIVALSLAGAIIVVLIGLNARVTDGASTGAVISGTAGELLDETRHLLTVFLRCLRIA